MSQLQRSNVNQMEKGSDKGSPLYKVPKVFYADMVVICVRIEAREKYHKDHRVHLQICNTKSLAVDLTYKIQCD
jgi:hypothetical protein